jgi:hypothetical protein
VSCNIGTERCFGGLYIEDTGVLALRKSEDDIGVIGISDGDGVRNVGCCGIILILLQRLGDSLINIFFTGDREGDNMNCKLVFTISHVINTKSSSVLPHDKNFLYQCR